MVVFFFFFVASEEVQFVHELTVLCQRDSTGCLLQFNMLSIVEHVYHVDLLN